MEREETEEKESVRKTEKERHEMKYKVGDKVRVRSDLQISRRYGVCMFASGMDHYKGSVVTISKATPTFYRIEEDEGNWTWADKMLEGLADDELTVEEAIILRSEMCANTSCCDCKLSGHNNGTGISCNEFSKKYPERVIEILKQRKKEHEKKPIETERAIMVRVLARNDCNGKCVHEEEVPSGETWDQAQARVLKEYCENHEGKYISTICGICRVKE